MSFLLAGGAELLRCPVVGNVMSSNSGSPPIDALGVDSRAEPRLDSLLGRAGVGSVGTVESIVEDWDADGSELDGATVESDDITADDEPQFVQGGAVAARDA